jgi:hypothetical protein
LVNETAVSIHHAAFARRICRVAFIFDKRAGLMVNRWFALMRIMHSQLFRA